MVPKLSTRVRDCLRAAPWAPWVEADHYDQLVSDETYAVRDTVSSELCLEYRTERHLYSLPDYAYSLTKLVWRCRPKIFGRAWEVRSR